MAKDEKTNAVNETLKLPLNEQFDHDLEARLQEQEAGPVTIATLDIVTFAAIWSVSVGAAARPATRSRRRERERAERTDGWSGWETTATW